MISAMVSSEFAAELPALALFFTTGIFGCLVAKWFREQLVVPRKSAAKSIKSCEIGEEGLCEKTQSTASAGEVKQLSKGGEKRARRRRRSAQNPNASANVEKALSAESASPMNEHASTVSAEMRATKASSVGAQKEGMAAKRASCSQRRLAAKAEIDNVRHDTQMPHELGTGNMQPSTPIDNESKRDTDKADGAMADSCSDARSLDFKLSDVSEESDKLESSPQRCPQEQTVDPCEPITAALQKLHQRLSEVSSIRHRFEGSSHLGLSAPANDEIQKATSHVGLGSALGQKKNRDSADNQQCGDIREFCPESPRASDEEDSDEDDEKYDEALRAIIERAQAAECQSIASHSSAIAAPTWSPVRGHSAWAHQPAPAAPNTLPDQHDIAILPTPSGAKAGAQPLVPCANDPAFYTDGQQVYHPVYVKVDPDAGSVLDPQVHAVVECDDPEYAAYLNYINACQSVVVMAQAPGSDKACPQLALVPNTPHVLNHWSTCDDGDCWNMSWDEAC